jgi:hypothetical protein
MSVTGLRTAVESAEGIARDWQDHPKRGDYQDNP